MKTDALLSVAAVAEMLSLSDRSVRRMIDKGELRTTRVGPSRKSLRVLPASVKVHMQTGQESPNAFPVSQKHF